MLESIARGKYCPFTTQDPIIASAEFVVAHGPRIPKCTGSNCMAWVKYSLERSEEPKGYCELLPETRNVA